MTRSSGLQVADPRYAVRLLYQALAVTLGRDGSGALPRMSPRPLLPKQIVAGASEFAVSSTGQAMGAKVAGSRQRRTYLGYVALHFGLDANPGDGLDEDALITAVLENFAGLMRQHAAQLPGLTFSGLDGIDGDLFVNDTPTKASLPAVLTLTVNFNLTLDLKIEFK